MRGKHTGTCGMAGVERKRLGDPDAIRALCALWMTHRLNIKRTKSRGLLA